MASYTPKSLTLEKNGDNFIFNFDDKVDKNQGVENAGKALGINAQGIVEPTEMKAGGSTYYAVCDTAADTQVKAVTISDITELETGLSVRIKFTNAHSYNGQPKLQINSLAAKNIVRNGTTAAEIYEWNAGEVLDFIYDGTNFAIVSGASPTTTYYGSRVKLSSSTSSTSEELAATPKGVKEAYDLANSKAANTAFTGATSSTDGVKGLVPAPLTGEHKLYLKGDGTWAEPDGVRLYVADLDTVTNTSGSYTHTSTVTGMTGDLKAVLIECSNPEIFKDKVTITTGADSVTLTCADVAGTSTVKVSFAVQGNANPLNSTEYAALDARIGDLSDLTTSDKSSVVGAVNALNSNLTQIGAELFSGTLAQNSVVTNADKYNVFAVKVDDDNVGSGSGIRINGTTIRISAVTKNSNNQAVARFIQVSFSSDGKTVSGITKLPNDSRGDIIQIIGIA